MQNAPEPRENAHTTSDTTVAPLLSALAESSSHERDAADRPGAYAWALFWVGSGAACVVLFLAHVVYRFAS